MPIRERRGHWHYRFQVNGHTYQGNTGLVATERNRTAAIRIEAKARELVLSGRSHELKLEVVAFDDAAAPFLKWCDAEYREHPNSAKRIRVSFASLTEFFGNSPVSAITAGRVEDYKAWRRTEHQVKEVTLRHDLHALSPFFAYGIKHNWARVNPVKAVEIPSDADAVRMHVVTPEEEARYFETAERWPNLHDVGRLIILQGLRPEEAMELRKDLVDLANGTVTVAHGKTKAARRTLKLTSEARTILGIRIAQASLSPWVFPSPRREGKPITKLNNVHQHAQEASGTSFVLYDLRHTCATRWVQAGIDLPTVAKWLGHNNLRSVHKYVHPTPEHDVAMARRYEAYLETLRSAAGEPKGMMQ
jgi:integrase